MAERSGLSCLDPETIVPISRQTTEVFKTGTWTSIRPGFREKTSPCRAACPNGNNIPVAARAAAREDFDGALAAFLEESPLPGVCGRVCHHPCQSPCSRALLEGPVGVRDLERAAADLGEAQPEILSRAGEGRPVAVVGSGPAGLSCAYHLARLGHPVTLVEAADRPGGLLARGIPPFRLPQERLARDLERIWSLGVDLQTGQEVDRKALTRLAQEHEAVFLALGAQAQVGLGLPGEDLTGVVLGLDFLRSRELQGLARGAKVAVIGGGNTALDAARTALRAGAGRVTMVYRRSQEQMPAFGDEVAEAGAEGVEIRTLTAPVGFMGRGGRLTAILISRQELGPAGPDGRPEPVPAGHEPRELACDLAVIAAGQRPVQEPLLSGLSWEGGRIWVDGRGQTSRPNLFAGGDLTPARASVVDALATGKRAAAGIHLALSPDHDQESLSSINLGPGPAFSITAWIKGPGDWRPDLVACPDQTTLLFAPASSPRRPPSIEPGELVKSGWESSQGLSASQAAEEAARCLSCGTCIGCDRCYVFCPEGAVIPPEGEGRAYAARGEFCKGCGICASVCLRGVMEPGGEG